MAIKTKPTKVHWNYFLALESDVSHLARFIEFSELNFRTYSIELAHLLMAAASEVDVVAKLVCKQIDPIRNPRNIAGYASIILPYEPALATLAVVVPRFGLTLNPWISWTATTSPLWWGAYNAVKHRRDTSFAEANLQNCLNAVAGLFCLTIYYYALLRQPTVVIDNLTVPRGRPNLSSESGRRSLTGWLLPKPELFRIRGVLDEFSASQTEEEGGIS